MDLIDYIIISVIIGGFFEDLKQEIKKLQREIDELKKERRKINE